jgi:hypothetical protein
LSTAFNRGRQQALSTDERSGLHVMRHTSEVYRSVIAFAWWLLLWLTAAAAATAAATAAAGRWSIVATSSFEVSGMITPRTMADVFAPAAPAAGKPATTTTRAAWADSTATTADNH